MVSNGPHVAMLAEPSAVAAQLGMLMSQIVMPVVPNLYWQLYSETGPIGLVDINTDGIAYCKFSC